MLDGGFQHTGVGCAVPTGRAGALEILAAFVENAKKSGLVRKALDMHGFNDAEVAPPA